MDLGPIDLPVKPFYASFLSETTEKERQDLENHPFFDDHPGGDPVL